MASSSSATSCGSIRYVIDPRTSQFTVQAFANGLIAAIAHSPKIAIRDWTGVLDVASDTFRDASIHIRVKAASLEVLDEMPDRDRRELHRIMNLEVLESAKFPEITYESTLVTTDKMKDDLYRVNVRGRLNLHGVSNEQDVAAQAAIGVDSIRAHGSFTLLQTDYDIRIASIAGGSLKLMDELKFSFYVVARKTAVTT
jgi:polyisoprenoid-binding protein YceI